MYRLICTGRLTLSLSAVEWPILGIPELYIYHVNLFILCPRVNFNGSSPHKNSKIGKKKKWGDVFMKYSFNFVSLLSRVLLRASRLDTGVQIVQFNFPPYQ